MPNDISVIQGCMFIEHLFSVKTTVHVRYLITAHTVVIGCAVRSTILTIKTSHDRFGEDLAQQKVVSLVWIGFIKRLLLLTVWTKQWSLSSWAYSTPSLMKTEMALRMKDTNRFMWMKFLVQWSFLERRQREIHHMLSCPNLPVHKHVMKM